MIRLLLTLLILLPASPASAASITPQDRAALQALADEADRHWNMKNVAGMTATYSHHASLRTSPEGELLVGRPAIGRFFAVAFARRPGEFRHLTQLHSIDMLSSDAALSEGDVRVERKADNGSWVLARRFRTLSLAERTEAGWRLRWVRAIPLP